MTSKQHAALKHLPAVIDALAALAKEREQLMSLLGPAGFSPPNGVGQPAVPVNNGGPGLPSAQTPAFPINPAALRAPPMQLTPEQIKAQEEWRNSPARKKLLDTMRTLEDGAAELPASISALEKGPS